MHYRKSIFRSLAMVTQLGLCVVTPVFLCVFIGYQIDTRFEVKTMIPMLILGVLAGGRCAWQMAKRTLLQEQKEDECLRREQSARNSRTGISRPKQPSRIRKDAQAADEGNSQTIKEADEDGMAK